MPLCPLTLIAETHSARNGVTMKRNERCRSEFSKATIFITDLLSEQAMIDLDSSRAEHTLLPGNEEHFSLQRASYLEERFGSKTTWPLQGIRCAWMLVQEIVNKPLGLRAIQLSEFETLGGVSGIPWC
jgi:hypothetical protein